MQTSIANDRFTFTDIPDIILKHKPEYTRAECDRLTDLLIKVKNLYLQRKLEDERAKNKVDQFDDDTGRTQAEGKKLADMVITEEDLVPKELFDDVLNEIEEKFESKKEIWYDELVRDQLNALKAKLAELTGSKITET